MNSDCPTGVPYTFLQSQYYKAEFVTAFLYFFAMDLIHGQLPFSAYLQNLIPRSANLARIKKLFQWNQSECLAYFGIWVQTKQ